MPRRLLLVLLTLVLTALAACSSDDPAVDDAGTSATATTAGGTSTTASGTATTGGGPVELETKDVVTGLDTVWAMEFDGDDRLWFTQRGGRLQQVGGAGRDIPGVVEQGEGGLMGLEVDDDGRFYLMYSAASDNRIVRLNTLTANPEVLVDGIRKGGIHNGGRLRFAPDGTLYAGAGDSGDTSLPQKDDSLNGKILRVDAERKTASVVSKGRRNPQGLCFNKAGTFYVTEHGPDRGDEVDIIEQGKNGGWPGTSGNGIKNYTPTIALAGCALYEADAIPQWRGSLLFVTLKDSDLRRLTFAADGSVAGEEVLYDEEFGRLRDVVVGPDGFVYIATSNKDGRGSPQRGDDRIVRIAPKGTSGP